MKRLDIIFFTILSICIISCKETGYSSLGPTSDSFIISYINPENGSDSLIVYIDPDQPNSYKGFQLAYQTRSFPGEEYRADNPNNSRNTQLFEETAKLLGDTSYNSNFVFDGTVLIDTVSSITLRSEPSYFAESKTNLDSFITIGYSMPNEFIKSGYDRENYYEIIQRNELLIKFNQSPKAFIGIAIGLTPLKAPDSSDEYVFTSQINFTSGKSIVFISKPVYLEAE